MAEIEKEAAVPFTVETTSKQEMIDHLLDVHGLHNVRGHSLNRNAKTTKVTREEMQRAHDRAHAILDSDPADQIDAGIHVQSRSAPGQTRRPSVPHVHDDPKVAPEVSTMLETLRAGGSLMPEGKIMPAGQRSVLTKLVNNDFAAMRADISSLAAAALENELKQLELEWQDREAKKATWQEEVRKVARKTNKKLETLKSQAAEEGIELTFSYRINDYIRADARMAGYDKAVSEVKTRNKRYLDGALLKVERERLRLERRILLSGIEPEAAEVLNQVPSAEAMMRDAMAREVEGALTVNT